MWDKPPVMMWVANLLFAFAALLLVYALLFLTVHLPVFPLKEVVVEGQLKHVTREQVQFIVKEQLKGNFFTLDLARTRQAFEKLPWVREVNVRRRWPDRLEVVLEEHTALARWGNLALVNDRGELFKAASSRELPVFIGPMGTEREIAQRYVQFGKQLAPLGLKPVKVTLSARRAWRMRLDNGLVIELGRDEIDTRLTKFAGAYSTTLARFQVPVEYVDLRYPNGFAVKMQPEKGKDAERREREQNKRAA